MRWNQCQSMNRENYIYSPSPPPFPNNNSQANFSQERGQFQNINELKRSGQSDLVIFNGQSPKIDYYAGYESNNRNLPPPRTVKSNSQKALPIIYNSYNEGGLQMRGMSPSFDGRDVPVSQKQGGDYNQNAYNNYQGQDRPQTYQLSQNGKQQFHTFQNIPHQNELPTAKFLNFNQHTAPQGDNFANSASDIEQYHPTESYRQVRQEPVIFQPQPNFQPQSSLNRPVGRFAIAPTIAPTIPLPISSRSRVQIIDDKSQHYNQPSMMQQTRVKLVQIPQDEYQKFVEHLPICKKIQQEHRYYKQKWQQFQKKQQFYSHQNSTLRDQNKRLRELVNHFEKRQKQLVKDREDIRWYFQQQIRKYRQSILQQFALLIQRYRLQSQRAK